MEKINKSETKHSPVNCPERPEVAREAFAQLSRGMANLGFSTCKLPEVKIVFSESTDKDRPLLGQVQVKGDKVFIVYDKSFATQDGEKELTSALRSRGNDYPGMSHTLSHELSHIAMWSVTGMERQPVIRLLDEGWATLVPIAGVEEKFDIKNLAEQVKGRVVQGLQEEPDVYRRCLDLSDPVTENEGGLNEAEYNVGAALLLWAARGKGPSTIAELLRKSPQATVHNDEQMEPAHLDPAMHSLSAEHSSLVQRAGQMDKSALAQEARSWEAKQFQAALLEVTGYATIQEAQNAFQEWLGV